MARFEVSIDEAKFEPFGWVPTFDVDAYDELIHTELQLPTPDKQLAIHIAPHKHLTPDMQCVPPRPFSNAPTGTYDMEGNI